MKAIYITLVALLVMLSVVSAAGTADVQTDGFRYYQCQDTTIVAGTVYDPSNDVGIEGASVEVKCNNNTLYDTTDASGHYSVDFEGYQCDYGDLVYVEASKDNMVGSNQDLVNDGQFEVACRCEVNIGIVDVPLIPEFGLIVGTLTIAGALVAFLVMRRH